MLSEFAARYFPHAAGPTLTLKECMFTNAPDGHFIIDLHPEFPQVSFASACSGHGYKFASVIGEILGRPSRAPAEPPQHQPLCAHTLRRDRPEQAPPREEIR